MNDENKRQMEAIARWVTELNGPSPSEKRIAKLTEALHQIATASPCVYHPGADRERTCVLCQTFINVARDALGRERWPAESVPLDTSRDGVHNAAKETPMNTIAKLFLLLSFAATASAVIVRPDSKEDGLALRDQLTNSGVPVRVIQLPAKIVNVNVAGKTETKYVTLPARKAVVPAAEFAGMKKEWDDELEAAQCEIALKYAYRLDIAPIADDTIGNAKKADVDAAAKACAAAPSAMTRKALVAAVERYIAR